jgi:hypothetical protein
MVMSKITSLFVIGSFFVFFFTGWNSVDNGTLKQAIALSDTTKKDPSNGFIIDQNYELLIAHCTACHEAKVVTNFKANREGWLEKIRWMQKTQKLWDLGEAEPKILDYLAKHYAPRQNNYRRNPLKDIQWYKLER